MDGLPLGDRYRQLGLDECFALLARAPVGRIGVSIKAIPEILPVNYAVVNRNIVFRTVKGSSLHRGSVGAVVAFEVDFFDPGTREAWSVLVRGRGREPAESDEVRQAAAVSSLESWALDGAATTVVCIEPELVSGRWLTGLNVDAPSATEVAQLSQEEGLP